MSKIKVNQKNHVNCCVVGGAGFIGIHVVNALIKAKRNVSVIDRNPNLKKYFPSNVKCNSGDFGDKLFLEKALKNVDEIIFLAYASVPKTSFIDPLHDINSNLPRVINFFNVISTLNLKNLIIFSSGGAIYGKTNKNLIDENHPTNPISPYGITKLAVEKYALMYRHFNNIPIIIIRPSNAYGQGQKPFSGQGFIATMTASILTGKTVYIFGKKGTIRDYIHVEDIANGVIAVLEKGTPGETYNLGSGIGLNNREVIDFLKKLGAKKFQFDIEILPKRKFDVPYNVLNIRKIIKDTGWEPQISFSKGIEMTWDWYFQKFIFGEN